MSGPSSVGPKDTPEVELARKGPVGASPAMDFSVPMAMPDPTAPLSPPNEGAKVDEYMKEAWKRVKDPEMRVILLVIFGMKIMRAFFIDSGLKTVLDRFTSLFKRDVTFKKAQSAIISKVTVAAEGSPKVSRVADAVGAAVISRAVTALDEEGEEKGLTIGQRVERNIEREIRSVLSHFNERSYPKVSKDRLHDYKRALEQALRDNTELPAALRQEDADIVHYQVKLRNAIAYVKARNTSKSEEDFRKDVRFNVNLLLDRPTRDLAFLLAGVPQSKGK